MPSDWSGRAMALSGLRMMPTFPLPSLKFRTAGFPLYGFQAGFSDRACPGNASHASLGLPPSFALPAAYVGPPFGAGGLQRNFQAILASYACLLEPFFLFSAHRFFIMSDNRFLPAGVRWSRFFLVLVALWETAILLVVLGD